MSVRYLSTILDQFETNVGLIDNASSRTGVLKRAIQRWPIESNPDSAMDGKFYLDATDLEPKYRAWGTGECITDGELTIELSYYRGGGDKGGGDRATVMRHAADDCQRIADVCENPENYNSDVTGLRQVRYLGARRTHDLPRAEVWEARFFVEWRSDLATTPVIDPASSGDDVIYVDGIYVGTIQLDDYDASDLDEGAQAYVATVKAIFTLRASSATPSTGLRVDAFGKSGYQWTRELTRNAVWEAETSWFVDPQNVAANDENSGLTALAPLATLKELSRRLARAEFASGTTVAVTLASDCASTDKPVWTFLVGSGAAAGDGLIITGTPGTALYSGTVTGFTQQTQGSVAVADDNQLTDSGIPTSFTASGLVATGYIYKRTNSTALYWFPLEDLGSKTLRMSDALTTAATPAITALTVNDTYDVLPLPKIYDQFFPGPSGNQSRVTIALCDSRATQTSGGAVPKYRAPVTYDRCTFSTSQDLSNARFVNCAWWVAPAFGTSNFVVIVGGAFIGAGPVFSNAILQTSLNVHFQACSLSLTGFGNTMGIVSFYGAANCVSLITGTAKINVIKGKNNTGKLIRCVDMGAVIGYNSTTAPPVVAGSSSDPLPIQCGNTTVAGTSIDPGSLPLVAEIGTRMLGVVPF